MRMKMKKKRRKMVMTKLWNVTKDMLGKRAQVPGKLRIV